MTKIQNMFRTLEDLNFVIVSACDEPLGLSSSALSSLPKGSGRRLSRVDFEFRASNFRFRHLNTYDQFWRDFYKLLLGRDTRAWSKKHMGDITLAIFPKSKIFIAVK